MLNENAQKWVDALRSGRFKQGKHTLTQIDNDGIQRDCCLGVACKVAIENGVPIAVNVRYDTLDGPRVLIREYDGCSGSILPESVTEFLGMFNERNGLDDLNDYQGLSFEQIADHIEQNADRLFV